MKFLLVMALGFSVQSFASEDGTEHYSICLDMSSRRANHQMQEAYRGTRGTALSDYEFNNVMQLNKAMVEGINRGFDFKKFMDYSKSRKPAVTGIDEKRHRATYERMFLELNCGDMDQPRYAQGSVSNNWTEPSRTSRMQEMDYILGPTSGGAPTGTPSSTSGSKTAE